MGEGRRGLGKLWDQREEMGDGRWELAEETGTGDRRRKQETTSWVLVLVRDLDGVTGDGEGDR